VGSCHEASLYLFGAYCQLNARFFRVSDWGSVRLCEFLVSISAVLRVWSQYDRIVNTIVCQQRN